jgi:hypothetical protein
MLDHRSRWKWCRQRSRLNLGVSATTEKVGLSLEQARRVWEAGEPPERA